MAYRLRPGEPLGSEVIRLTVKQLELAARRLRGASQRWDDRAVHVGRRHIKKARALARFARKGLGTQFGPTNQELRAIARTLAPLTDSDVVIGTLAEVKARAGEALFDTTYRELHATLIRRKERAIEQARSKRVLQVAVKQLHQEAEVVRNWVLVLRGTPTIAAALRRSFRRARRAAQSAATHPTTAAFTIYRRRVKDLWLHLRLVERLCSGRLAPLQRQLEELDGCLDAYRNTLLLQRVILIEPLDSRRQAVTVLRLLRGYQDALRRQAVTIAKPIFTITPRQLAAKVRPPLPAQSGGLRQREPAQCPPAA